MGCLPPPLTSLIFDPVSPSTVADVVLNETSPVQPRRQLFLTSCPDRVSEGDTTKFQDLIARFFLANYAGFSVVESPAFVEMLRFLRTGLVSACGLPCRVRLGTTCPDALYAKIKARVETFS